MDQEKIEQIEKLQKEIDHQFARLRIARDNFIKINGGFPRDGKTINKIIDAYAGGVDISNETYLNEITRTFILIALNKEFDEEHERLKDEKSNLYDMRYRLLLESGNLE